MFAVRTSSIRSGFLGSLGLLATLSLAGCSDGIATTYPVTGKIVAKGGPLVGGGEVRFVAAETGAGLPAALGQIDAQGNFTLSTYGPGDGVAAGRYRVEVVQNDVLEPERRAQVTDADGKTSDGDVVSAARRLPASQRIHPAFATPQSPAIVAVEAQQATVVVDLDAFAGELPVSSTATDAADSTH